jgi:cytochrome c oxidase assembly factor CtaG
MLMTMLGHVGQPLAPHDLLSSWNPDPVILFGLALAGWAYRSGWQVIPAHRRKGHHVLYFSLGLATIGVALLSPIDALAAALVSGHMLQHLLLIIVAAPLIILGDPLVLLRGLPHDVRKTTGAWRRRMNTGPKWLRWSRYPVAIFLAHAGVIWLWHASIPYEAATRSDVLHALEHWTFLITALLFWSAVLPGRSASTRAPGLAVMLIFAVAMQGVLLSALLTFSDQPWYPIYADTALHWGIDPIDDQRLAGLIMWIPSGLIYTSAALASLVAWLHRSELPGRFRTSHEV